MTPLFLLVLGLGIVAWCSRYSKRRQFTEGPNRTAHLKEWDASEPVIRKLALPDVKPLQAQRAAKATKQPMKVAQFGKRRTRA